MCFVESTELDARRTPRAASARALHLSKSMQRATTPGGDPERPAEPGPPSEVPPKSPTPRVPPTPKPTPTKPTKPEVDPPPGPSKPPRSNPQA